MAQELHEWLEVAPAQGNSHIWTSETFCLYLEFLGREIRSRRRCLGLSMQDKCLIVCDTATQHSCQTYRKIHEAWAAQHNVAL